MTTWKIRPEEVTVYCDEQADRTLFMKFGEVEPFLTGIPQQSIRILPKGRSLHEPKVAQIVELAEYDRPDFIFLYRGIPVLVVELTEHGYTGDNPLQRFTRFATTAENQIPFIYFTPFSRVRDDELDLYGGDKASKRNVNTNVWKGMTRLTEIYQVPQIAVDWPLAANGKPRKPGIGATSGLIKEIFGELIQTVVNLLQLSPEVARKQSILDSPFVSGKVEEVRRLWVNPNTRDSAIRATLERDQFIRFLSNPRTILDRITRESYFYSDKPERLLALQCILESELSYLITRSGIRRTDGLIRLLQSILSQPVFDKPFVYYTGYQWRSDPLCGLVVNLDYLYCRTEHGRTPRDRSSALVVYWPRVFSNKQSRVFKTVKQEIDDLKERKGTLFEMFVGRYGSIEEADLRVDQLLSWRGSTRALDKLIGVWGENTKQARIMRRYCDILVLADAVVVGDHWQDRI